jgi:hypothetical protein
MLFEMVDFEFGNFHMAGIADILSMVFQAGNCNTPFVIARKVVSVRGDMWRK